MKSLKLLLAFGFGCMATLGLGCAHCEDTEPRIMVFNHTDLTYDVEILYSNDSLSAKFDSVTKNVFTNWRSFPKGDITVLLKKFRSDSILWREFPELLNCHEYEVSIDTVDRFSLKVSQRD